MYQIVIGHNKSRKKDTTWVLYYKSSKLRMINLTNSEKPDKPIGSSGFSAGLKHICSYRAEYQNLTFGKDTPRLRPQYCSSSTIKS